MTQPIHGMWIEQLSPQSKLKLQSFNELLEASLEVSRMLKRAMITNPTTQRLDAAVSKFEGEANGKTKT